MSAVSDYAAKQTKYNSDISTAIDDIVALEKQLNDKITQLQNNPGPISDADQALLDGLVADGAALRDRVKAADTLTPPTVPPAVANA